LETPFTSYRELSIEITSHVALAFRGISSVGGTLLVPQYAGVALGVVLIAGIDSGLIPRDLLE
jgi:hypothetical protein